MLFFMIPVLIYGVITLKEHFPHSETKAAGVTFGAMFSTFFAPLLILLFGLHAVTGYVELGTDSWSTMENCRRRSVNRTPRTSAPSSSTAPA